MTRTPGPTPPECDPEQVETVARAIHDAERAHGPFYFPCKCGWEAAFGAGWEDRGDRHRLMSIAAAAIAALPTSPSPAEEAVKRVEAVAEWCEQQAESRRPYAVVVPGYRQTIIPYEAVADRLRAALASPAPAPQGEEGIVWAKHVGSCRVFYAERRCTCGATA